MHKKRYVILSVTFALLMLSAQLFVSLKRQDSAKRDAPELERLVDLHPKGWRAISSSSNDSLWVQATTGTYDSGVYRLYQNDVGHRVMLVLIWSHDGMHQMSHAQQNCYNAQGYSIFELQEHNIALQVGTLQAASFSALRPNGQVEDVLYWRVNSWDTIAPADFAKKRSFVGELKRRAIQLKKLFGFVAGELPDDVMVRISAIRQEPDAPSTLPVDYARRYLQELSPEDRKVLTGLY
jgi:hypothetical protein